MRKSSLLILLSLLTLLPLHAQKISVLGDSYSTFYLCTQPDTNDIWYYPIKHPKHKRNDVTAKEQCWWALLIEMLNKNNTPATAPGQANTSTATASGQTNTSTATASLERLNAYSGSTICYSGYAKDKSAPRVPLEGYTEMCDYSLRSFVNRTNNLGNPDIILVCGGTNDSWAGAPIGDYVFGNWTHLQLYTFRPAMAKMLYDLKLNYPTARILFMLNNKLKDEINESVHTICQHYAIECLDLKDIDKQSNHPSQKGMQQIAQQVYDALKQ